jgi:hypothetical protein
LLRSSTERIGLIMYVPAGTSTVPPAAGSESIAAWKALVSSAEPLPRAPKSRTLTTADPRARRGGAIALGARFAGAAIETAAATGPAAAITGSARRIELRRKFLRGREVSGASALEGRLMRYL